MSVSSVVKPVLVTEEQLDKWCDKYLAPILKSKIKEPGPFLTALGFNNDQQRDASIIKSIQTKLGFAYQSIAFEIIKINNRFTEKSNSLIPSKEDADDKRSWDFKFSCKSNCEDLTLPQKKTYRFYVQSSIVTKNGDGKGAIVKKENEILDGISVVIIAQEPPNFKGEHRKVKERIEGIRGKDDAPEKHTLIGSEALRFLSDGNADIYEQILEAFSRWSDRHRLLKTL
jgi:hypothetical protein